MGGRGGWLAMSVAGASLLAACSSGEASPPTSPVTSLTTSPVTTTPVTTSPVTTTPVTTSLVTTSPVTTSPVTTSPVTTSPVTTSPVGDTAFGGGVAFSVRGALGQIPASMIADADTIDIAIVDLVSLTAALGTTRPEQPTDFSALLEWLGYDDAGSTSAFNVNDEILVSSEQIEPGAMQAEFGFGLTDLDAVAKVTALPPLSEYLVMAGPVAPKSGLPDVAPGIVSVGEGDDNQIGDPTSTRPLGMPVRLAATDGLVVASRSTSLVADWLVGAESGTLDSVAADPRFADLAAALDGERPLAANVHAAADPDTAFVAAGVGITDPRAASFVVAFAYDSADAAADGADDVTDLLDDDSWTIVDTTVAGSVVLVRATAVDPNAAFDVWRPILTG